MMLVRIGSTLAAICTLSVFTSFHLNCLADHHGVPNATLIKENAGIAALYREKSVLEQNSVDIAWKLLMEDRFQALRRAIYCNEKELQRFREVIVVTVLATDIADAELKARRNARWTKAFDTSESCSSEDAKETKDRKATIVIEHLIQASDIAHTMQASMSVVYYVTLRIFF